MSAHAPAIVECAPRPYLGLGPGAAEALGLGEGDLAVIETYGALLSLPVKVISSLAPDVAAIPTGLPGLEGVLPPFHARISRAPAAPEAASAAPAPAAGRPQVGGADV